MRKRSNLLIASGCLIGLATGFSASQLRSSRPQQADASATQESTTSRARATAKSEYASSSANRENPHTATAVKLAMGSPPHSSDTLATALSLDQFTEFERLALWMLDASAEDIADYWEQHRDIKTKNREITDLVFINWTRLDPKAATAAVNGTQYDEFAWWAWACHDPHQALAESLANRPERIPNVTWGIGEFHGEWMRDHFDQIPESGRNNALMALGKWDDTNDPLGVLNFFKDNNAGHFGSGVFGSLVRQDPWAAFDWVQQNGGMSGADGYSGRFIDVLHNSHPEMLAKIAEMTDSLELKARLSQMAFDDLLASDPSAALKSAEENKSPLLKSDALAKVGLAYVKSDPAKAVAILQDMLSSKIPAARILTADSGTPNDDPFASTNSLESLNQGSIAELIKTLIKSEPEQLMRIAMSSNANGDLVQGFGSEWAETSLSAYQDWVGAQTDPTVRESSTNIVISKLLQNRSYSEAMDWATSQSELSSNNRISGVYYEWLRNDRASASHWLKTATLPQEQKDNLNMLTNP